MNRRGVGGQPLRGIPDNVFQNQQQPGPRNGALGSGRLQNSKLSNNNSGWMAGALGLQNPQSRAAPFSSFTQTKDGSVPLDLSEFPSLSGVPQQQQQQQQHQHQQQQQQQQQQQSSASQAIWSNPRLRNPQQPQQAPVGRPHAAGQRTQAPTQAQRSADNASSPFLQLGGESLDDYHFSSEGTASRSGHQSGVDDFPPLGGLGVTDGGQARRVASTQDSRFNGMGDHGGFELGHSQGREGGMGPLDTHHDSMVPSNQSIMSPVGIGAGATPASRSPMDTMLREQEGQDQNVGSRARRDLSPGYYGRSSDATSHASENGVDMSYTQSKQSVGSVPGLSDGPGAERIATSQLNGIDRYGFAGFLDRIHGGTDQAGLAWGLDLNTLGLDLNRVNSPLFKDWSGPFPDPMGRSVIPEFELPAAYTVQNVPPIESRISSFSDETLFAIFYQNPRDTAQELSANELYARDWRWHKKLQQWMMKAPEFGDPVMLPSMKEERGFYYFFDAQNWRRERKEFILNYDHLYHSRPAVAS